MKSHQKINRLLVRILVTIIVGGIALAFVFPFVWMLSTSFKYEIDVMEVPLRLIPKDWNFTNYTTVWRNSNFPSYYLNSIKVTLLTIMGELCVTTMAAYAFAKLEFRGKKTLFMLYLATMMVPGQVLLLPKYIYFSKLALTNSHIALILPGFFSVFGVLLIRQAFMQLPFELTESAYIDGANHAYIFTRIMLPLSKPSIMTLLLLSFTWSWNDYINPLVFLSSEKLFTITVGLQRFQEEASTNYALIMAGATISLIPIIMIFLFTQKYFIESFASAGIKG